MNENEEKAFGLVYRFYRKWRETILETPEQWLALTEDYKKNWEELDAENNPLAMRLLHAAMDAIGDLYSGGMKPVPANYFGRDDM